MSRSQKKKKKKKKKKKRRHHGGNKSPVARELAQQLGEKLKKELAVSWSTWDSAFTLLRRMCVASIAMLPMALLSQNSVYLAGYVSVFVLPTLGRA